VRTSTCYPDRSYSTSFSNIATNDEVGILNQDSSNPFDIKIYPNPTSEILTLYPEIRVQILQTQIYDLQGKLVQNIEGDKTNIDITTLNSGVYLLKITTPTHPIYRKFVVKK
jgi:hypothetical protein